MTLNIESSRFTCSIARSNALHGAVRRALHPTRRWLGAGVIAAGFAGVIPLAAAAPFPPVFPLASLYPAGGGDGSQGFVLQGLSADDRAGWSVSVAGDLNGDGIDDVIIGAPGAAPPYGPRRAGESYVVFGSTQGFLPVLPLDALFPDRGGDGSRGFVLTGIDYGDGSGHSVSYAGDVNGDGTDDVIVAAFLADANGHSNSGESYVIFGSTQRFPALFPLSTLFPAGGGDGSRGFVLSGIDTKDYCLSVSTAGDVNGDGIDDLVVGAGQADPGGNSDAGESYVVFGSTNGFPPVLRLAALFPAGGGDGSRGSVLTGIDPDDVSGHRASAAGDVNGDGIGDLMIGAFDADPGGHPGAGESYVVFGSTLGFPPVLPLSTLFPAHGGDGSRGFVIAGIDAYDSSGYALSAAGDVNGDGIDDLIIGAEGADQANRSQVGESYVVFGSTQGFPPVLPLATLLPIGGGDGSRGFVLAGVNGGDLSGLSVNAAGDVNGDGIGDLIIGATHADPEERNGAGESYLVFGSTQGFPPVLQLASLFPAGGGDGSRGFVLEGVHAYDHLGQSVSAAGDVNADGFDDLVIGADGAAPGAWQRGESYVVFGRSSAP